MASTRALPGTRPFIAASEDRDRLFRASCFALVASALSFAMRGDILGELSIRFWLDKERLGWIAGAAFWGPTVSVFLGGQLCDFLGMRRLLQLAFLAHLTGTLLTIFAAGFWYLWAGTLSIGTANGLVEAAINPLVATVYPQQKTQKLNALHAWFPGGIVIGGLGAAGLTEIHFHSQAMMALILVPTFLYGWMFLKLRFPPPERVQQGISTAAMYSEGLRPQFLIWIFCMLLTASTELGPNQWIPNILTNTVHLQGILVLVWINGLMAAGRMVAGPVVHRLSSLGLLTGGSCFSAVGLFLLSLAGSRTSALLAATALRWGSATSGRPCWGRRPRGSPRAGRSSWGQLARPGISPLL